MTKENNKAQKTQTRFQENSNLKERAKALRKAGILSEVLLWVQLKSKKFKGLDFNRQKIIGNYIVDFYCRSKKAIIEIDGITHIGKKEYDERRRAFFESLGLTIITICDRDVKQDLRGVMEFLYNHKAFI